VIRVAEAVTQSNIKAAIIHIALLSELLAVGLAAVSVGLMETVNTAGIKDDQMQHYS